jgi:hypothetical protein
MGIGKTVVERQSLRPNHNGNRENGSREAVSPPEMEWE